MQGCMLPISVADPGCLSRIRISISHPCRVKKDFRSRIRIRIKEFKYFFQKIVSDLDFLPIPDPGSRESKRQRIPDPGITQKGTGYRIRVRNTAHHWVSGPAQTQTSVIQLILGLALV